MTTVDKQLSNPFSTGGGGPAFEARVQAAFVVLMLTDGVAPCLRPWPIKKIKLQGKRAGYDTDDVIVFVEAPHEGRCAKLLAQVRHSIAIAKANSAFQDAIGAAWRDFTNAKLFAIGVDAIALITGPLSATDAEVRTILEWARHAEDAQDFLKKVNQTNFSSKTKRSKLTVLRHCLDKANGGSALSDDQLWRFLRNFNLLEVDLDVESGFVQSLIGSLLSQCAPGEESAVWSMLVTMVQTESQNEGTITRESIPDELKERCQKRVASRMPARLAGTSSRQVSQDWSQKSFAHDLGLAFLMGGWSDSVAGDLEIGTLLSKRDSAEWMASVRVTLQDPDAPISLHNGTWTTRERAAVWETLGKSIFDSDLDTFRRAAVDVLSERDPMFDLPPEERYLANIKGKLLGHSPTLRQGIADTLAVLGGKPEFFTNCSEGKPITTALLVVREVLGKADWILWGSLNNVLPLLAEAAPREFLDAVETALQRTPCPFSKLFVEEGKGAMGNNYLTGLLWAMETLAWDEQFLTRVAVILADLGGIDPGGTWSNRPANSLTTIFLPWFPQTEAPVAKRQMAVRTVAKEVPDGAWRLLLSLLPNQHQMSSGCHKPRWRQTIPEDRDKGVTRAEYLDQVSCYSDLAVGLAEGVPDRLRELVGFLDSLPPPVFDRLLGHLESAAITSLPESERMPVWSSLVDFTGRHRRHADAEWALADDVLRRIERVSRKLAPETPFNRHRRLFSEKDFDLFDEDGDWEEQEKKLNERRETAIREIHKLGGIANVVRFAREVESASRVGTAMGGVATREDDSVLFPKMLTEGDRVLAQFLASYIWMRQSTGGWQWVDQTVSKGWPVEQIGQFLRCLPFCRDTWARVTALLGDLETEYWSKVLFNPFQAKDAVDTAVDKLLDHNRPNAAIDCLYAARHMKAPSDHARTVRALLAAAQVDETPRSMDVHQSVELIKVLQEDPATAPDDLFRIEWAYLPALDGHNGARPTLLEHRLASDPKFFCEVIRLVFRSKREDAERREPTKRERNLASNAFRLLHGWVTPPGSLADGTFSPAAFSEWLEEVKRTCRETGHIEVGLSQVGHVLIHVPASPNGLWMDETVADALNAKDAKDMRSGFRSGLFNVRGAHLVDPTGKPELDLAAKYKQRADSLEQAGYHRLATTMRDLSESYVLEAKRIVEEHKRRGGE